MSAPPPLLALVDSAAEMGGVEFSTLYLAEQLDAARFRRLVICPAEGGLAQRCRERGIPVLVVPRPRFRATSARLGSRYIPNPLAWGLNLLGFLLAARRLARELRRQQVDLVCTKGLAAHFYGGLAARWARRPCVWHVQDLVSRRAGGLYAAVLGRAAGRLAGQVIADGSPIRDQLAPFVPAARLSVVYNGVDTAVFSPRVAGGAVRAEWGVTPDQVLIGNVARLTRWKGQDHLLRAFAALESDFPGARLVLVGAPVFGVDGYEAELRRSARDLGVEARVIFAGYRWDLPQVLAALDVFVHASVEKDTSPLAVVSAMAAGKAIVSTAVAGVAELFGPACEALLVPPGDAPALEQGLRGLLADPARRAALGCAARGKAEQQLSLTEFTRRCEAIFAAALHGQDRPS